MLPFWIARKYLIQVLYFLVIITKFCEMSVGGIHFLWNLSHQSGKEDFSPHALFYRRQDLLNLLGSHALAVALLIEQWSLGMEDCDSQMWKRTQSCMRWIRTYRLLSLGVALITAPVKSQDYLFYFSIIIYYLKGVPLLWRLAISIIPLKMPWHCKYLITL